MKRFALDWLEIGIDATSEEIDFFIDYFRISYLGVVGSSSRFYNEEIKSETFGLSYQYGLKPGLKNNSSYLRLTGRFFQNPDHELLVNTIFAFLYDLKIPFSVSRIDACVDIISTMGELENYPVPVPIKPQSRMKFITNDLGVVETYFSGRSDCRLRVYDKLLECPDYEELYGIPAVALECWRVEFQLRGQTLREVCKGLVLDYDTLLGVGLGQAGRRFKIKNLTLPVSSVSGYKKAVPTLHGQANFHIHKIRKSLLALSSLGLKPADYIMAGILQ